MERFRLEKSQDQQGLWVLTDTENLIVIKFEDGKFNDTQKTSFINDDAVDKLGAQGLARVMREMGEYMVKYHGDVAFSQPYGFKYSEDEEELYLYRRKFPAWELRVINDNISNRELANSLKKAAEWLSKKDLINRSSERD